MSFVSPDARSGGSLVVACDVEMFFEKFVGEYSGLRESIYATSDFEVDPTVVNAGGKVVFFDEFVGDVGELDFDVFITFEWSLEVEVAAVKGGKLGAGAGEDAVKD